jgi:hypothetical protein
MNKKIITVLSVVFSLLVITWSGCKKDNGPQVEEFTIQIDSIVHPDTINFGEKLSIKFYGLVGPNGCYEFDRLVPEYFSEVNELAVECLGIHTFNDVCTEILVYMDGQELLVSDVPAGSLIIKGIQPDGSVISQTVFVKE